MAASYTAPTHRPDPSFPCSSVVSTHVVTYLCGEDVAGAPADLCTERREGFDQHRGLDGHVQRSRDLGAPERLRDAEIGPACASAELPHCVNRVLYSRHALM